jgi:hypothetical protein
MIEEDKIQRALAEVALVIGSAAVLHHLDDDLVWMLMKRLDRIRARLLRELRGLPPLDALPPLDDAPEAMADHLHPAVEAFIKRK